MNHSALLVLEDGTVFRGVSIGADGCSAGEVVFNTAMTGYQEILTDPSYSKQLVTLTYPHIGNTGTNDEDEESDRIQAAALIIHSLPLIPSNFRSTCSLPDYLKQHGVVAISEKTYTCDDGNTYHYAEFISRYKKMGTYKVDEDE